MHVFVWVCAPGKERSINHILCNWSYSWFWAALWVLEPTQILKKQQVLTTKPPLHLLWQTPFILSTRRGVQEDQKFKIILSCTCIWSQSGLQVRHPFKKKKMLSVWAVRVCICVYMRDWDLGGGWLFGFKIGAHCVVLLPSLRSTCLCFSALELKLLVLQSNNKGHCLKWGSAGRWWVFQCGADAYWLATLAHTFQQIDVLHKAHSRRCLLKRYLGTRRVCCPLTRYWGQK